MPFARTFALSVAALLLAGCFDSKAPLVDPKTSDHVAPDRGRYETLKRQDGKWVHDSYFRLTLARTGAKAGWYRIRAEHEDDGGVVLSRIDATRFLAQVDGSDGYWYGLLVRDRNAWLTYDLDKLCREFTAEETERFGIRSRSSGDCEVTSLEGLKRYLVENAGSLPEPGLKYVRR